uniref:long-chain-fatty-acid--CoA ligase n=1 Tax=Angiostrongylus cantonensis TaxID=6313 RepID=A0A0K0DMB2_ANGCA
NIDNHVGSCGFFPIYPFISSLYPVRLIKVDQETGELVRDSNGLCVPCRPGEVGEMVGVIKNKDLLLKFEGYVNKGDTQKKIYHDVFAYGDQVFSSGDILYWDKLGYLYFRDRRGDTFRWKGENVSTTEVERILQPVMSVVDATVYGVKVGKHEGRAGMAAIALSDGIDVHTFLEEIAKRSRENLASYAIPVFIRLCKEVDRTGTFKLKKIDLQRQGFDLVLCSGDPVYYWNSHIKGYSLLDAQMQKDIETGAYNRI